MALFTLYGPVILSAPFCSAICGTEESPPTSCQVSLDKLCSLEEMGRATVALYLGPLSSFMVLNRLWRMGHKWHNL